jgi:(1->4)-alpha-D-glucan 1-alpha-D-glucosylmutase
MMAKSMEDTAFYRYHRLLALNEVGGEPAASGLSVADFHKEMQARAEDWPHGMTATATHDTKRGEDNRARILALSEMAEDWAEAARGWRRLNAPHVTSQGNLRVPSAAHEYMLYQALLGAWPLDGVDKSFIERMQGYAIKAAREGKQQTAWLAPNEEYEAGLTAFLQRILQSNAFVQPFEQFARRTALIGALNSLSQVALKATMPGVPDFYQGTELWDLSLVDPDNRRPVDFSARASASQEVAGQEDWPALAQVWPNGRIKLALTRRLLALRNTFADAFTHGSYRPLAVSGPHSDEILAFARVHEGEAVIVVAARLFARATEKGRRWPSGQAWDGTAVSAEGFSSVQPLLGGKASAAGTQLAVSELFQGMPVGVLQAKQVRSTAKRRAVAPLVAAN